MSDERSNPNSYPTCSDLAAGNEEDWHAFWVNAAEDLLRYCSKYLSGAGKTAMEEVRDDAVSIVFEKVSSGAVVDDPRRFAFGVVRNLCRKALEARSKGVEESVSTIPAASAFRPSRIAGAEEEGRLMRDVVGRVLKRAREEVFAEVCADVRQGVPTAPLLHWAVLDLEFGAREGAPSLTDLLGIEKSRVAKLRKNVLARLGSGDELQRLPNADPSLVLAWDGAAEIWGKRLFGCPRYFPPVKFMGEHLGDLETLRRIHADAVDCPVCSAGKVVVASEAAALGRSYGAAAVQRSRI